MKKKYYFLLLSCLSLLSVAQNTEWKVTSSVITFKIKNAGITVDGVFSALNATVIFDPNKGFGNKIEASIEAGTVNTGNNARDTHLKKEEYFSVGKFPKISMKASTFSKEADGRFKGFFTLTIKGTSNTIPVVFSFVEAGTKGKLQTEFKINRLEYRVGEKSLLTSNDVIINIEVNVIK